ncbi:MAG: SPOR domain-containing protein [Herminiimonas sp.]|nr:SPOR domain-containing protein [Herminiimonas sp.]
MIYSRKTSLAPAPRQAQAGGTVLGIIIGLVVGLGIAIVVAVMITKSSLPFTNKQAQPERASAGTAQITDPNKPLYGNKEPAREAAKSFSQAPPENAVIADAKPPVVEKSTADKPADKPAAKPAEKASDKASDKVAMVKPDGADEKWIYFLQAGAFREPSDAENAKAKLALMGFEASISERPSDSGPLYRVRVGPFNQLEVMTRARTKLSDNGVDVAVVRTAR